VRAEYDKLPRQAKSVEVKKALAVVIGFALTLTAISCTKSVRQQGVLGDWQGTIEAGSGKSRLILRISEGRDNNLRGTLFTIDQNPDWGFGLPATVKLEKSSIKLSVDDIGGRYDGKINPDKVSIDGIWVQGGSQSLRFQRPTTETMWRDTSPHKIQFIPVDTNVSLEVIDWGGSGRPVVLLAGMGNTAHVFDRFAPKLTDVYHVYGITRRGFGASSAPDTGYLADRLGDDVQAVLKSLDLKAPVLVGHSIAGEELSSVGTRYPGMVAGLVYLDAAYSYAYYDRFKGDLTIDLVQLRRTLDDVWQGERKRDPKQVIRKLLEIDLSRMQTLLRERLKDMEAAGDAVQESALSPIAEKIVDGMQKYTDINVPVLAIYALSGEYKADTEVQAKALEKGIPSAHVVRLQGADHVVFMSNESDVLREINNFIVALP